MVVNNFDNNVDNDWDSDDITFLKISGWTKKRNPVCDGGGAGLPKIPSSRFWRQIPLDCGPINSSSDGKNLDPIRSG